MKSVIMKKLNPQGFELWHYPATMTHEDETMIQLEAPFNGRELELMGTPIRKGDIFKETFYKTAGTTFLPSMTGRMATSRGGIAISACPW